MKRYDDEHTALAAAASETAAAIDAMLAEVSAPEVRRLLEDLKERVSDGRFFTEALDARSWLRSCRLAYPWGADLFENETGSSPGTFLRDCRLAIAARLLASTTVSVAATAELTGFAERSPFYRAFEQWCGQLPQEFRERAQWRPELRLPAGREILSTAFLTRLLRGEADEDDALAVFDWVLDLLVAYLADPDPELLDVLERRLARELWEERLAPRPMPHALVQCRRLFQTDALEELLAEEGFGEEDPRSG